MEDKASHPLGRIVPAVGTNSSNGCNNNRFGRELYHLPQVRQTNVRLSGGVGKISSTPCIHRYIHRLFH